MRKVLGNVWHDGSHSVHVGHEQTGSEGLHRKKLTSSVLKAQQYGFIQNFIFYHAARNLDSLALTGRAETSLGFEFKIRIDFGVSRNDWVKKVYCRMMGEQGLIHFASQERQCDQNSAKRRMANSLSAYLTAPR